MRPPDTRACALSVIWGRTWEGLVIDHLPSGHGGRCEIRTHEGLASLPVFKTGALNRSANLPMFCWKPPAAQASVWEPTFRSRDLSMDCLDLEHVFPGLLETPRYTPYST